MPAWPDSALVARQPTRNSCFLESIRRHRAKAHQEHMPQRLRSGTAPSLIGGPPLLHNHPRLTAFNDLRTPRRYSIKSFGYIRLAVSKAALPIRRLAARANTSSLPFVRTTLNGQSSENIGPAY
jgi:hypothetical protein